MKKLLTLILLTPLLSSEPEQYLCATNGFDGNPLIIDRELKSISFINRVYKYDWTKHHNGYSAKSEPPKEPLHPSFTSKNFEKIRWFAWNKVIILTNWANNEFVYICKAVN